MINTPVHEDTEKLLLLADIRMARRSLQEVDDAMAQLETLVISSCDRLPRYNHALLPDATVLRRHAQEVKKLATAITD